MTIDLALLCDAATVDVAGKLNILGVFDRIHAPEFPAQHGRIALVLRLEAEGPDAGVHEVTIRLRTPSGGELLRLDGNLEVGPAAGEFITRIPHVLNLDGVVFPGSGVYAFEIIVDDEVLAEVPLALVGQGESGGAPRVPSPGIPVFMGPKGPVQA
jgi:hypothetical protein